MSEELKNNYKSGSRTRLVQPYKLWQFSAITFGLSLAIDLVRGRIIHFYDTVIQLPIAVISVAYIFYGIWDALNDPLIGHLSDRNYKFTRKWGRRFPWIVLATIPFGIVICLMFIPPDPNKYIVLTVIWFFLSLILFDGLYSIIEVNISALIPLKFTDVKQRTTFQGIRNVFLLGGGIVAIILPPILLGEYGEQSTYPLLAVIAAIVVVVFISISLPVLREEKEIIDIYYNENQPHTSIIKSFVKILKKVFNNKNSYPLFINSICTFGWNVLFVGSIPYYNQFVLNNDPSQELLLYAPYILATFIAAPIGIKLSKKIGHVKLFKIIAVPFGLMTTVFAFKFDSLYPLMVLAFLIGFGATLYNISSGVMRNDYFDEMALNNNERMEGGIGGILGVLSRGGYIIQVVVIWAIRILTGLDVAADALDQTPLALLGLRIQAGLIPGILILIGWIFYMTIWDLNPEKTKKIREQLVERNLV